MLQVYKSWLDYLHVLTSVNLSYVLTYSACLGVGAASMAKLTFMVGGVEEEYNAAQELLTCMGANVVYCGQVGSGQVKAMRGHVKNHMHTVHTLAHTEYLSICFCTLCPNISST